MFTQRTPHYGRFELRVCPLSDPSLRTEYNELSEACLDAHQLLLAPNSTQAGPRHAFCWSDEPGCCDFDGTRKMHAPLALSLTSFPLDSSPRTRLHDLIGLLLTIVAAAGMHWSSPSQRRSADRAPFHAHDNPLLPRSRA